MGFFPWRLHSGRCERRPVVNGHESMLALRSVSSSSTTLRSFRPFRDDTVSTHSSSYEPYTTLEVIKTWLPYYENCLSTMASSVSSQRRRRTSQPNPACCDALLTWHGPLVQIFSTDLAELLPEKSFRNQQRDWKTMLEERVWICMVCKKVMMSNKSFRNFPSDTICIFICWVFLKSAYKTQISMKRRAVSEPKMTNSMRLTFHFKVLSFDRMVVEKGK